MTAEAPPRPRISAVIPAYDREQAVIRAIESVLAQTEPPIEVIVIDDGSRDATAARARGCADSVRVITQENAGAGAARNRGVREATGEWIAFLDSDDYWRPEHLSHVARAIIATEGRANVYFADLKRPADEGSASQFELAGYVCPSDHELRDDGRDWALAPRQPLMLQASVFRRDTYLEAGGIWEALRAREDTHLFFRLLIGQPACAMGHVATEMTASDVSGERLSIKYQESGQHLEQTVQLYRDLLGRDDGHDPILTTAERRELARRVAAAELGLARRSLEAGRLGATGRHLLRSFLAHPGRLLDAVRRRLPRSSAAEPTRKESPSPETRVS